LADLASERARIARELHDGIAQDLAAIGYSLDAEIGRTDTSALSRAALRSIRGEITTLNEKMREEIFHLRSNTSPSAQEDLIATLQSLPIDFTVEGELPADETGIELEKVLVELVRNSIQHAGADEVHIAIDSERITFRSNESSSSTPTGRRFGLQGVLERLHEIAWEIEIADDYSLITLSKSL
jgi:NarL family two-component system sensor histidine kinase LiaS